MNTIRLGKIQSKCRRQQRKGNKKLISKLVKTYQTNFNTELTENEYRLKNLKTEEKELNAEIENNIHMLKIDGIDIGHLQLLLNNLSQLLKNVPPNIKKNLYNL